MHEQQNIEFKESWRDEYLKWICGFANAQGGKVCIGIDDKGNLIGVADYKKLLEDIPNKVKDILGIIVDVNLRAENGKNIIEIKVDAQPYPINYKGQYHYRSGSTKQELKGIALNKFLLEKTGKHWDGIPVPAVSVSDLKRDSFVRYKEKAVRSNRIDEDVLNDSDELLLGDLHLLENGMLKRAAILLFHPQPENYIQGAYIKIGFFHTDDDLAFQDEVHGNLIEQIDKADDLLRSKYFTYAITYSGTSRIEKPPFPEKAIREALLNAIAHKDYADGTPIQISVYTDNIVFWNPGHLPVNWTEEDLKIKHPSIPHNPDIANALFRCGDIEAWGRGTLKMIRESILHKTLPPEFDFRFTGFMVRFSKDVRTVLLRKRLAPNLITIVEFAIENGVVTNSKVQEILKTSKRTSSRYLSELEGVYLVRKGETGKGTTYAIKGLSDGA